MMPIYEGIALIQEKQAVVLDLGTDYTKFGFTGEPAPRCIIRSEFWSPSDRRMKRVYEYKTPEELYENLVHMLHLLYFRHVLVNPKERKVVVVESLLTPTLFRETLAKVLFLHYEVGGVVWADSARLCAMTLGTWCALVVNIGARDAEVAPGMCTVYLQEMSHCQVGGVVWADSARLCAMTLGTWCALVVNIGARDAEVAPGMCTVYLQEMSHCQVGGVVWADSARLCAMTLGTWCALVVNIGARDAEVAPVVHASPVLRALQSQPLGARALHDELARLLDEDNGNELHLSEHILEDIKVKTCFVASRARALQWESPAPPSPAKPVQYGVAGGGTITVSGRTRERAGEVLFARDNEMTSLGDVVLHCIMQCPIDTRRPLAENILVTGGSANLPGLKARLAEELRYLVTQPPYSSRLSLTFKFHSAPAHDNSVAWLGAAVLAAGDALATRALSRDVFTRDRRLRDWVCLLDNTPLDHPHRENNEI